MEEIIIFTYNKLRQQFGKAIPIMIALFFGITVFAVFEHFSYFIEKFNVFISVLSPFIIGFAFTFLLSKPMSFLEKKLLSKTKLNKKQKYFVSAFMAYVITIICILGMFMLIIPQLVVSVQNFVNSLPSAKEDFSNFLIANEDKYQQFIILIESMNVNLSNLSSMFTETLQSFIPTLLTFTGSFAKNMYNFVIGFILSVYMVASKEKFKLQLRKVTYALIPKDKAEKIINVTGYANNVFTGFISGKIIDSIIIGILCFILMTIFKMPYAVLISFIIGITNIIPFFGPFIGAVPGIIIILTVNPTTALWFAVLILALQQFDGNVLGPLILGDSTGLSAFWVMFAILIFGGLFGFWGMLLGVPTFAVIYTLLKEYIEIKLANKQMPIETKAYGEGKIGWN